MTARRNDPWGNGMAQVLLAMPVRIAARWVPQGTVPAGA